MFTKLNLKYEDRVFIKGVSSSIDGEEVKVIGVAQRGPIDNYIIEFLDGNTRMSIENYGQDSVEYKSLVLPEVCLSKTKTFMEQLEEL